MKDDNNVVSTVSRAVNAALLRDLPAFPTRSYMGGKERISAERRPDEYEVEVFVFPELWPSTALGYGGMGGSATTHAYTVIVACRHTDTACIYWGQTGNLGRTESYADALDLSRGRDTSK